MLSAPIIQCSSHVRLNVLHVCTMTKIPLLPYPIEYLSQQPSGPCKREWFAGFIEFLEFNKWHNERNSFMFIADKKCEVVD